MPANREDSPAGGGLELQREDGQWLSVPPVPDSLVVNIGDYMHLLTGGRFKVGLTLQFTSNCVAIHL